MVRSALVSVFVLYALVALAVAQTCPSSGISCYPSDCSTSFRQCVGTTFYPVQQCASGTKCDQGIIINTADVCKGGSSGTTTTTTKAPTGSPVTTTKGPVATTTTSAPSGSCRLSDIFSEAQFNALFPHANGANKRGDANQGGPFTYSGLIQAAASYPAFSCTGDITTRRRELAAFLAQTSHETSGWWSGQPYNWGYFYSSELCAPNCPYCGGGSYACASGQAYYGRGPMQLSWNYNYGAASQAIYGNSAVLLNNPDSVAKDAVVAFKTALWFWMTSQSPKPSCHDVITGLWTPSSSDSAAGRLPGFGMLTNIINGGLECGFATPAQVLSRVGYYNTYTSYFGISGGSNVYCDKMQHY